MQPTVMQLPASATLAEACALLGALGNGPDVIDASALTHFDTSAIALLLEARRRAIARGAQLQVRSAPPKLVELATLYGVEALLGLEPPAASLAPSGPSASAAPSVS